jgi:hypothetical protein
MKRDATIGDLESLVRREIADRQAFLNELHARLFDDHATGHKRHGIGAAAVDVLRDTGRPMHGLDELLPALAARGYRVRNRSGFATILLRTGKIVRTAPGTYAYAAPVPANDAG